MSADLQRVKTLLTETIVLLCKSGLHFKNEFTVEGLLGITIDKSDIFLINLKETIKVSNHLKSPENPVDFSISPSSQKSQNISSHSYDGSQTKLHKVNSDILSSLQTSLPLEQPLNCLLSCSHLENKIQEPTSPPCRSEKADKKPSSSNSITTTNNNVIEKFSNLIHQINPLINTERPNHSIQNSPTNKNEKNKNSSSFLSYSTDKNTTSNNDYSKALHISQQENKKKPRVDNIVKFYHYDNDNYHKEENHKDFESNNNNLDNNNNCDISNNLDNNNNYYNNNYDYKNNYDTNNNNNDNNNNYNITNNNNNFDNNNNNLAETINVKQEEIEVTNHISDHTIYNPLCNNDNMESFNTSFNSIKSDESFCNENPLLNNSIVSEDSFNNFSSSFLNNDSFNHYNYNIDYHKTSTTTTKPKRKHKRNYQLITNSCKPSLDHSLHLTNQLKEQQVELLPGSGVLVSLSAYELFTGEQWSRGSKLVRRVVREVFPDEQTLARSSCLGKRMGGCHVGLDHHKVHTIKAFVQQRMPSVSHTEIVAAINECCRDIRAKLRKSFYRNNKPLVIPALKPL